MTINSHKTAVDSSAWSLEHAADRPKRVAVVGAGLAGLACADKLIAQGHIVDVFEARRRVGGRVLSQRPTGQSAEATELGGEFIGANHREWQRYAKEFNLTLIPADPEALSQYIKCGKPLSDAEYNDVKRSVEGHQAYMTFLAEFIDSDAPWRSRDARRWDMTSAQRWVEQRQIGYAAHHQALLADIEGLNGIPAERQSMLAHLSQIAGGGLHRYWTDSQTERCAGGNDRLSESLMARIGTDNIHLGCPVSSISAAHDGVGPALQLGQGRVWHGDAVVVTAPPSCWDKLLFTQGEPLVMRPQLSNTTKHITYLAAKPTPYQISNFYADHSRLTCEMWTLSAPARAPHALVTFVPIRERLAPGSTQKTIEEALALLGWQAQPNLKRLSLAWQDEPFSGGGYAFPAPHEITQLGERLYSAQDGLLFAGDWAQYSHSGYMEGALRSGLRGAHIISGESRP